ncbi:MAG: VPLPA-CTERM sorting domain-containing protein [Gammaproteobacteria bacterium]
MLPTLSGLLAFGYMAVAGVVSVRPVISIKKAGNNEQQIYGAIIMQKSHLISALCAVALNIVPQTLSAASFTTLPNGFNLYNTGDVDGNSEDNNYYMTLNPYNGSASAFLNSASYLSVNTVDSSWIGPSGVNVDAPEEEYRIAIEIDLTSINVSTFSLDGFWVSDNQGLDILVNGNSTGQTNTGNHTQAPDASADNAFTLSGLDGLIAGINIIEFEWVNIPFTSANPTHVRVEFSGYSVVPVPAAVWLFGSGLLGLVGMARRKKAA